MCVIVLLCCTCDVIVIKAFLDLMGEEPPPHLPPPHTYTPSLSVSHPPLAPPQLIGCNRSPPCIQRLSARGEEAAEMER